MANTAKTTTKNKKSKNNNTGLIIGICAAVAVIVVVIVVSIFVFGKNGINDDYFKSDDTKYVLTIDSGEIDSNSEYANFTPIKTHVVYTYEGDTITGMTTYGEFADNAAALKAFDAMKEAGQDMTNTTVEGKYIVVVGDESAYKDMTASDVKSYIDFMESIKDYNIDESTDGLDGDIEEDTETEETNTETNE